MRLAVRQAGAWALEKCPPHSYPATVTVRDVWNPGPDLWKAAAMRTQYVLSYSCERMSLPEFDSSRMKL